MAPLDWGLGHTTRCLPILKHLEALGAEIFFAGNDAQQTFLRRQIPHLHFLPLEGYNVQYAQTGAGFMSKMLRQIPAIGQRIKEEHNWLRKIVAEHKIEGVISDNRYGLWHPHIPSVVLCHQLQLHTNLGTLADTLASAFNRRLLSKFGAIWVPDVPAAPGLSGKLAHPKKLPAGVQYMGPLSQFSPFLPVANAPSKKLVVLLSGPEPQRTLLSNLLWKQVGDSRLPAVFIEGKENAPKRHSSPFVEWYPLLASRELQKTLERASYVVCRGGYTTVMDAATLNLKLLTIPTPGQGEQQYLGKLLEMEGKGLCFSQQDFNLERALEKADAFNFANRFFAGRNEGLFEGVLGEWYGGL